MSPRQARGTAASAHMLLLPAVAAAPVLPNLPRPTCCFLDRVRAIFLPSQCTLVHECA